MEQPSLPCQPDSVDRCGRHRREVESGQVPFLTFLMHVGLLRLMSQPLPRIAPGAVICPGLNGSQFVRVSWLRYRSLQKCVGGDASQGSVLGEIAKPIVNYTDKLVSLVMLPMPSGIVPLSRLVERSLPSFLQQ